MDKPDLTEYNVTNVKRGKILKLVEPKKLGSTFLRGNFHRNLLRGALNYSKQKMPFTFDEH